MLKRVYFIDNPLDFNSYIIYEVEDILAFLATKFDKWPDTGRIYHKQVSENCDVTPSDEASIKKLSNLEGDFYCVIYPADPISILYAVVALVVVATLLIRPTIPTISQRNQQTSSPNNELAKRTNEPRLNSRIPDIFGKVRSTPDLLAVPFSIFVGNQEVETCLMCIGRGQYEIHDAYDDETEWADILGSSIQVYHPNTDIVSDTPYYQIGEPITQLPVNAKRSNSVNGQVLRPPNSNFFKGVDNVIFKRSNSIKLISGTGLDFTETFVSGDVLTLDKAIIYSGNVTLNKSARVQSATTFEIELGVSTTMPPELIAGINIKLIGTAFTTYSGGSIDGIYFLDGIYEIASVALITSGTDHFCRVMLVSPATENPRWNDFASFGVSNFAPTTIEVANGDVLYDLEGTYSIISVSSDEILLSSPSTIKPDWLIIPILGTNPTSPLMSTSSEKWIGPFVLESTSRTGIIANFISANGLYKDNGENQYAAGVDINLEVTPVNISNVPIGSPTIYYINLTGSSVNKETRASTLNIATGFTGRCLVRARRINTTDLDFKGSIVDEVKWRDLYSVSPLPSFNFGNVTVLRSQSLATAGALALKERKLNMLVTRQINHYQSGSLSGLVSTRKASHIIDFICRDQKIGNRQLSEIDFTNIYAKTSEVESYFGTTDAAEFCYTFDKQISFEESVQMIANSIFCIAYRQGSVIKLSFERQTNDSTLLFNHRNKLPGSEKRSITFGNSNDNDGLELEYVSPEDDALVTIYLPADRSAINPEKLETVGVRNFKQAYFMAWRVYNKIRYQNMSIEFDATQEADLTITADRILVSDNTRPNTQDGQIENQIGLIVYTSQDINWTIGISYVMFLQLTDKSTQSIAISPGPVPNSAVLATAPRLSLSVDPNSYAKTTYIIVGNDDVRQRAFLVSEKITQDGMTSKIKAGNYDSRFYEHDSDYINGII